MLCGMADLFIIGQSDGVASIGLDYLLMGVMRLGPAGAALGTTLSQAISVAVSLLVITTAQEPESLDLSVRQLAAAQTEAIIILGKVGFSISEELLKEGQYDRYDGTFLLLDEADRFGGALLSLPETLCVRVAGIVSSPRSSISGWSSLCGSIGFRSAAFPVRSHSLISALPTMRKNS